MLASTLHPESSSLCSTLLAIPCASVSGSKIFTFPPPLFAIPSARRPPLFAPRSPLALVPSFRGAKSSHSRRRILPSQGPAAASLCSPLPASPYTSVSGSKIFTFTPPDFALPSSRRPPLFAPRSSLSLVPPFRGAKSSHSRRRILPFRMSGGANMPVPRPQRGRNASPRSHSLPLGVAAAMRPTPAGVPPTFRRPAAAT